MAPKRRRSSPPNEDGTKRLSVDREGQTSSSEKIKNTETLANISRGSVGKLLTRVKSHGSKGFKVEDCSYLRPCNYSTGKLESDSKKSDKQPDDVMVTRTILNAASCSKDAEGNMPLEGKVEGQSSKLAYHDKGDEPDDTEWEDGSVSTSYSAKNIQDDSAQGVTVEFDVLPTPEKRKVARRATAEEKEVAEFVHKVHLLCLIGRGRLIDRACDDPLIQASLLSILPVYLLKIVEVPQVTSKALTPLVSWFHNNFRVRSASNTEKSFHSALASALETHEGTPEEVAALSVALFRALKLTARFVSILDVASLKPDADSSEFSGQGPMKAGDAIFNSSTLMVAGSNNPLVTRAKGTASDNKESSCETSLKGGSNTRTRKSQRGSSQSKNSSTPDKLKNGMLEQSTSVVEDQASDACLTETSVGPKRKGDLEYEMQLEMALSATAVESLQKNLTSEIAGSCSPSNVSSPFKRTKKIVTEESSSAHGISTAVGSRKVGAPLYWAEVYCNGENLTGKWVHVDVVNAIVDGEQQVEAAAAACKRSLRYVIAFAGQGAKDVTRRYCAKWYRIASQRINSVWWDEVLAPLKSLESASYDMNDNAESSIRNSVAASRSSLEDMELETRALTEPLPTNQQAYRHHPLYAIERWLNKYQILHPKGPVLGFCSGHPVYPRTCVQTLHTKERWMREGLQVKTDELPAKVLKHSQKNSKAEDGEEDKCIERDHKGTISLYGKWQTGPLCLPRAVDGIVPKNERGQVDVWSEKCLPPGTVHLRYPRVAMIAKRLEIDYAPAMVGFDFRNGRSVPVYEGIVVCSEFKDVILEAYAQEEERREAEERRKNEAQALSRWYQLLSSIVTRQRLQNCYKKDDESSQPLTNTSKLNVTCSSKADDVSEGTQNQQDINTQVENNPNKPSFILTEDHQHEFFFDDRTSDEEEASTRTKRCLCGFSIQIEEL